MSTTRALISVEQYLRTSYRPDCDYVDGEVVERNLGERDHSWLQIVLGRYMLNRYEHEGIFVFPELRVQVKAGRFRIPDLCVTIGFPKSTSSPSRPFSALRFSLPRIE